MKKSEISVFSEYLSRNKLKFTAERKMILEEIFNIHGHFEADDIIVNFRINKVAVSRASIYRTLPLLVQCGLLRKVYSEDKHSHFEHIYGHEHHDHLICMECGKTIEFSDDIIEGLQEKICIDNEFKPIFHKLEINGICKDCKKNENEAG